MQYPYYFLNQENWSNFWSKANPNNHSCQKILSQNKYLFVILYQYPWQLKQKFGYCGRFAAFESDSLLENLSPNELELEFLSLLKNVIKMAKEKDLVFVKFDFDHQILEKISQKSDLDFEKVKIFLKDAIQKLNQEEMSFKVKLNFKTKKIQYLATMTLDIETTLIKLQEKKLENESKMKILNDFYQKELEIVENIKVENINSELIPKPIKAEFFSDFYEKSSDFWKTVNQNIRRYTKKSLKKDWWITTSKTEQNFEKFFQVYQETSSRQDFAIHSKDYLQKFFKEKFSRIIIIQDGQGKPHCVWLGTASEQTLTYICGGNTDYSFKNYGQYLIHLVAIFVAVKENLRFYDLGGYDESLSFSDFKKNYKGEIRDFYGAVDMVLKPFKYNFVSFLIRIARIFRG
jgi:FemAB family